jgi:hypothetical protein
MAELVGVILSVTAQSIFYMSMSETIRVEFDFWNIS